MKNTGFGLIYGMGVGKLAETSGLTVSEAQELKRAYLAIFPGLQTLYQEMRRRAVAGEPVRTWGGRLYHCEPPAIVKGRLMTFDYKLLNVLVQGSSADCTKEAVVRHAEAKDPDTDLLANVHDELLASCPRGRRREAMECMRSAMEGVEFDVPMLTEGTWSDRSWADLKDYDRRGVLV